MRNARSTIWGVVAATVLAGAAVAVPSVPASAASLVAVTNFGSNPGNLAMNIYVPSSASASPAILLAMHGCGGSGPGFYQSSEFASLADRYGFIVIYPSASKKGNCFDNWSDASKVRGGATDPVSLMSMITYAEQQYHGDANRVFATGSSSGAMMTNAMLGLYPEVFKAGAAFMGVPFTCFPNEAAYSPGGNSAPCLNKTAQQWGDLVRNANPSYNGPWPRMQLWHGTADNVVAYTELAEEIKQWTNVNGLSQTPTSTDTPQSSWTRQHFANSSGTDLVQAISISGAGHSLPSSGQAAYAISFFGLDGGTTSTTTTTTSRMTTTTTSRSTTTTTTSGSTTSTTRNTTTTTTGSNGAGCSAAYTLVNSWGAGFVSSVTVTAGSSAIKGWRVTLTLPSGTSIANLWNGQASGSTGTVTVSNASYNGSVNAGGSTSFGFQGTGSGAGATVSCAVV